MKSNGPGKYDDLTTHVREEADADAVVLIVLDGNRGSGFSVQARGEGDILRRLPDMLEHVAAAIRRDTNHGAN